MLIKLKVGGQLRHYLPQGSSGSEIELDIAGGATAIDVMNQLGLPGEDSYLVMLNGTVLPTAKRAETALQSNDELGLFPPLKSG
jgi:sulfur carrier protein ThiS